MKPDAKILKTPVLSLVRIQWVDPSAKFGWTIETDVEFAECLSYAILTAIDETGVCITTTVELNSSVAHGALSLPWDVIRKFEAFEKVI